MKSLNRRNFIKNLTACAAGAGLSGGILPFTNQVALAEGICSSNRKTLVSIFLNGGPHGPSILVPRATQAYFDKHPNIGITNSLFLDANHGLHPSMTNLHNLYNQGKAVFMNGAGYPNHSRSHEDSKHILGSGLVGGNANNSGWAGRFASTYCASSELFSLFSFRGNIAEINAPGLSSPTASSLSAYGYSNDSQTPNNNRFVRQVISENRLTTGLNTTHQQHMQKAWETSDMAINTVAQVNSSFVNNGITYPNGVGSKLRDAAKLIASNVVTPRHIFINQGGYDTHGQQNNSLPNLLTNLDQSINAFWSDMLQRGLENDIIVLFYGEFGRTHENDTQGTDHGTGFFMGMVGNNVRGGVHSPAYAEADFTNSRPWVPVKFDYREVIEQIMIKHQNVDPTPIFPESFNRIGLNLFT